MTKSSLRSTLLMVPLLLLGTLQAGANQGKWLTNYKQALEEAKETNRPVLLDFTGSDWCPWCIQMDKDVLEKKQFQDYAAQHLILMMVDLPMGKPLPQKLQEQNNDLQERYGADVLPAYVLVNKNGDVLGQLTGYIPGGPSAFISKIRSFKK